MSNPFEAGNNEQGSTSKESVLDRHEVGANIRQLLSIATVTCASLFAPQTAEAKNPVQTGVETTTSASTAETPEDTLEAKAYQRILALSVQLSESLCKDDELNACADALRAIAPKSESTGDESAYFNTAEGDASSGDPFTHMSQLDLVLKDFKNPKVFNMDVVKPRIDSFGATLSSGENGKILNELQREVEGLKTIFESRPNFMITTTRSASRQYGNIFSNEPSGKKYLGYGSYEKKNADAHIVTQLPNPNSDFGNKEIYALMKAMEPLGKDLGKRFSTMMGCDPHSVTTNINLFSSVHLDTNGKVNKLPFNNVHPIFTIEACQHYISETPNSIKVSPFISLFNNSNGYGAPDLNQVRSTEEINVKLYNWGKSGTNMTQVNTTQAIQDTNRLIMTAGAKIDIPISGTDINFVPKFGLQYGYTVGGKKLTPMVSFSLVHKKSGVEIGLLPTGASVDGRNKNSPNVFYFSTKYSTTF